MSSFESIVAEAMARQAEMAAQSFAGKSENGKVVIEVGGDFSVKKVSIDPSAIVASAQAELEKMVQEAVSEAMGQVVLNMSQQMQMQMATSLGAMAGGGADLSGLLGSIGNMGLPKTNS